MKSCPSCDAPNGQSCRKGCPEYIHPRNHMVTLFTMIFMALHGH